MLMNNNTATGNLRIRGMIAKFVGIVAIALGFVIGIYGLEDSGSQWMKTSLGLLVTGMLAQGYALYCSVKHMHQIKGQPRS